MAVREATLGHSQVQPEQYLNAAYDTKERFISYWHQIEQLRKIDSEYTLEIGVGNGFLSNYLKSRGTNLFTLDIDYALAPDTIGSIRELPFKENSFDAVACFEVLEHIPYSHFRESLQELNRVSKRYVVVSLPDRDHYVSLSIRGPIVSRRELFVSIPRPLPLKSPTVAHEHFWEIGVAGYTLARVKQDIQFAGFNILNTYRIYETPFHRFFVLSK